MKIYIINDNERKAYRNKQCILNDTFKIRIEWIEQSLLFQIHENTSECYQFSLRKLMKNYNKMADTAAITQKNADSEERVSEQAAEDE